MKKPYQIDAQRAVKQFEAMAAEGNPAVQMVLPMAEMVGWLRKGVGAVGPPGRSARDGTVDGGRSARAELASAASRGRIARPTAGARNGASAL